MILVYEIIIAKARKGRTGCSDTICWFIGAAGLLGCSIVREEGFQVLVVFVSAEESLDLKKSNMVMVVDSSSCRGLLG